MKLTLIDTYLKAKRDHPLAVHLVMVGGFFECYGLDALVGGKGSGSVEQVACYCLGVVCVTVVATLAHMQVLCQFYGTNLMGANTRKAKEVPQAGVPLLNIVSTVQQLNQAGFLVVSGACAHGSA